MNANTPNEYQVRWDQLPEAPSPIGALGSIVARLGSEQHQELASATLDVELGLLGDRWQAGARRRERQISLISRRTLEALTSDEVRWTEPGDNLIVAFDLSEGSLSVGSELRVGGVVLRVSPAVHLGCARFARRFGDAAREWVNSPANRHLRLRGIYCEVMTGGTICSGDVVQRVV